MTFKTIGIPAMVLATALSAAPAFARGHGGGSSHGAHARAVAHHVSTHVVAQHNVAAPRVAPRVVSPYSGSPWHGWYGYAPYRPYYFRPHFSLGFGVYLGYPTPFYAYPYPVPVYGAGAPYGDVNVGPTSASYGGVALQFTPSDAAVYVDGNYVGIVSDFDGSRQPLTLVPGTHHIEITQNGFQPVTFDVTVQPGMVTPYQGALQPY